MKSDRLLTLFEVVSEDKDHSNTDVARFQRTGVFAPNERTAVSGVGAFERFSRALVTVTGSQ